MKTAILAASLLIALMPVRNAIQIDQNYSDLNHTDTLSDLKTSDEFVRHYEAGEFDVPLSYPGRYEGFEILTMTNGLSNYAETFFYVWNARGTQPKFEEYDTEGLLTGVSTYDVGYSVSMSVTGDFTDFSSYRLQFVDASSDWMFLKLKCSYDFRSVFKNAEYQAYEISEFEITDSPVSPTKSNAYSISKRFAFSGEKVSKVDEISTVILDPFADYYRIPGINGRTKEDVGTEGFAVFKYVGEGTLNFPDDDGNTLNAFNSDCGIQNGDYFNMMEGFADGTIKFEGDFTDVFYVTFTFDEALYGEIVGAKMSYSIRRHSTAYKMINGFVETFGDWPNNLEPNQDIEDWTRANMEPKEETVFLSTGDVGPYDALVNLKTLPGQRGEHNLPTWWKDRVAWCYGNAAEFDLPTIQTLDPMDLSGDYKKDPASNEKVTMENNPYAISDSTNAHLKANAPALGSKRYIFRYAMEDASLWTNYRISGQDIYALHYLQHSIVDNANILQLTCRKDGVIYTIAVVSDNTHTETDAHTPSNVPGYTFNWTWLYIALGIIGAIIIAKIVVWGWKKVTAK